MATSVIERGEEPTIPGYFAGGLRLPSVVHIIKDQPIEKLKNLPRLNLRDSIFGTDEHHDLK
jgi:hypothetical protein